MSETQARYAGKGYPCETHPHWTPATLRGMACGLPNGRETVALFFDTPDGPVRLMVTPATAVDLVRGITEELRQAATLMAQRARAADARPAMDVASLPACAAAAVTALEAHAPEHVEPFQRFLVERVLGRRWVEPDEATEAAGR